MKLYELLDELALIRKQITNNDLKSDVDSISVGSNDAVIIHLGSELIFLKGRPQDKQL